MTRRDDEDDDCERSGSHLPRRPLRCQCGDGLPGVCPGPANCPYSDFAEECEDEPEGEVDA